MTFDRRNYYMPARRFQLEAYPPISDAAAKTAKVLQLANITLKRRLVHFAQG